MVIGETEEPSWHKDTEQMTRSTREIHGLDDVIQVLSAYRDAGREADAVIEDVRSRRRHRAKAAWEKRQRFSELMEESDEPAVQEQIWTARRKAVTKVLSRRSLPRLTYRSMRAFALKWARRAVRAQKTFEEKRFVGPRGYSMCGKSDAWAEAIDNGRIRAVEYRRAALALREREER